MCVKKKFHISNKRFLRVWPQVRNSINAKGRYRKYTARQIVVEREQAEARDREEYERNQRMDLLERELDHFRELTRF